MDFAHEIRIWQMPILAGCVTSLGPMQLHYTLRAGKSVWDVLHNCLTVSRCVCVLRGKCRYWVQGGMWVAWRSLFRRPRLNCFLCRRHQVASAGWLPMSHRVLHPASHNSTDHLSPSPDSRGWHPLGEGGWVGECPVAQVQCWLPNLSPVWSDPPGYHCW